MKAIKVTKGKGKTLNVALVAHDTNPSLFRVFVQKSNYGLGKERLGWFVTNGTINGVIRSEAERVFASRSAT